MCGAFFISVNCSSSASVTSSCAVRTVLGSIVVAFGGILFLSVQVLSIFGFAIFVSMIVCFIVKGMGIAFIA